MVVNCCAFGCSEKLLKKGGPISFHSFPKDELRRKLWLIKVRRADFTSTKHAKVCSKHFTPDSYDTMKLGGRWLKKTAIPTLFDYPPHKTDPSTEKLMKELLEKYAERKPPPEEFPKRKRKHFIGDFNDEDMDDPEEARKVLHIAKSNHEDSRTKIRCLLTRNRRLEARLSSLQEKLEIAQKQLRWKKIICFQEHVQRQEKPENVKEICNSENTVKKDS